ncbi:MAG TPA: hypothetical protein VGF16_02350 [Bryobacteraceae bacterium]|jgi:hypothetical protein
MKRARIAGLVVLGASVAAQAPATVKQLMLDLIHPASNDILLSIFRGGPQTEAEWAAVRRGALTLAEAGNLLRARGPDQPDWIKDANLLAAAGTTAYRAAQSKDTKALAAVADLLDASCTACHKQYRPNVFPREGVSK